MVVYFSAMTDAEPAWLPCARAALGEAIAGDHVQAARHIVRMINVDDVGTALIGAPLMWIDTLFTTVGRPPTPTYVPVFVAGASPDQLWALRMVAARANGDMDAARKLFAEAASADSDYLTERLMALLALVAMKLGGRL